MSTYISGGIAVRLVILLLATALTASCQESPSRGPDTAPAAVETPAEQVVVPGAQLTAEPRSKGWWAALGLARKTSVKSARQRRHQVARRAARTAPHRARNPWRHSGGRDIGWPQCPRWSGNHGRHGLSQPMPDPGVRFVVVGVTNGRSFTPSPCLARHLRWVRNHHVHAAAYAFLTYPTRGQLRRHRGSGPYDGRRFLGALGNAGYASARYSIRVMQRHGFVTPHVWLDVEPSTSRPWSGRRSWNATVVRGWVHAYREAGYTVGFYSTTHLWHDIVGGLRLGLPEWRTAGPSSPRAALGRCHERSFQGGRAVLAQWWTTRRDFDRLCPGVAAQMEHYFHKW